MMARRNVQCVKPSDPPFLRKMKEQCGYNRMTIETKKQELQTDSDAYKDQSDELPQVVVLKIGDLTREEVDEVLKNEEQNLQDNKGAGSTSEGDPELVFSTKAKRSNSCTEGTGIKKKKVAHELKKKSTVKAVKDNRLLSFGEDDED